MPLVPGQDLGEAAVPAAALLAQHRAVLGRLGPGDRLGDEDDPAVDPLSPSQRCRRTTSSASSPMQSVAIPPTAGQHVLAEHAEGAGDDQQPAESRTSRRGRS